MVMSQVLGSQLCRGEIQSAEDQVTFSFLFFFGCICGILKVPGKGSNLHHSSDPSHCSDNAGSLTHSTTRERLCTPIFKKPTKGYMSWLMFTTQSFISIF